MVGDHENIGPDAKDTQQDREARKNSWRSQHHEDNVKLVGALNGIKNQLVTNEEEQERSDRQSANREWLTIWVVVATAAFAFGGDIIFYQTLVETRREAFIAREDSERAAEAAKGESEDALIRSSIDAENALKDAQKTSAAALKAALGANGISQDTANHQLRAYVYTRPTNIEDFAVGKSPAWGITVNMIGQTPAYDYRNSQVVAVGPYPNMPDVMNDYIPTKSGGSKSVLFPGDPWSAVTNMTCISAGGGEIRNCVLSNELFELLNASPPTLKLYLVGVVSYQDAFGKEHHTPYCYTYNIHPGATNQFEVCPGGYKRPD